MVDDGCHACRPQRLRDVVPPAFTYCHDNEERVHEFPNSGTRIGLPGREAHEIALPLVGILCRFMESIPRPQFPRFPLQGSNSMPIALPCPKCKAKLKGPDQLVGHTLKCPGCGTMVTIPASAIVSPPPPTPQSRQPHQDREQSRCRLHPAHATRRRQYPVAAARHAAPAKGTAGRKKTVEPPSLFDLPDDIGFKDDPAPPPPPPKPEQKKAPA